MTKNNRKVLSAVVTFTMSLMFMIGGAFAWYSASESAVTDGRFNIGSMDVNTEINVYNIQEDGTGIWETAEEIDVQHMIPGDSKFYAIQANSVGNAIGTLTFTLTGDYTDSGVAPHLVSKMMVLNVTSSDTLPDAPVSTGDPNVETDPNSQVQPGSIFEKTTDIRGQKINYVQTIDTHFMPNDSTYIILEFYFSGKAGNEFKSKSLILGKLYVENDQNTTVQPT